MSFILDALKKSENERQRQSGPALFEVKVATPRPGLPGWAVALAALLVVNIGVVLWLVLRKPAHADAPAVPAAAPPAALAAAPVAAAAPVQPAPAPAPAADASHEEAAPSDAAQQDDPVADSESSEPMNAEDYEPAIASSAPQAAGEGGRVVRGTMEGLPTYEQMATSGSVPDLKLDMHVYAAKPQERFVFINMQRVREGDSLPNGVRVEQITPDGVVLSHRGSRFVLERE